MEYGENSGALKKKKSAAAAGASSGKNKVLNGVDLLIEDSYEAEEGLSDTARAVGGLDYCLYAAITLYRNQIRSKMFESSSEREIDTYAILMADPDSYTPSKPFTRKKNRIYDAPAIRHDKNSTS